MLKKFNFFQRNFPMKFSIFAPGKYPSILNGHVFVMLRRDWKLSFYVQYTCILRYLIPRF